MPKYDREPVAWITRGGKHIPIFDKEDGKIKKGEWKTINGTRIFVEYESAGESKVGDYRIFYPPEDKGNDAWYGDTRPNQYNDSHVEGRVIKINRTTISVQKEIKGVWNYGRIYKIPKNAIATMDLSKYLKK